MIWDPFEEIARMHEEIDRLFSRVVRGTTPLLGTRGMKGKELAEYGYMRTPISNVYETENSVIATFELPGVEKKDIELNVNDSDIEVKVKKNVEKELRKKGVYSYERSAQQFYRRIPLPVQVKPEQVKAEYKNGVLRVEIPKAKKTESKKKKIQIE
jgi:HSP20 family protein